MKRRTVVIAIGGAVVLGVAASITMRGHGPTGSPEGLGNTLGIHTDPLPLRRIGNRQPIRADHGAR